MQINKIGNIPFGKIILDCNNPIPANLLFNAKSELDKNRPNNNYNPLDFMEDNLIVKVIDSDYNTPKLKARYKQLIAEQESNPHDIHIDLFLADEGEIPLYPEGWYQKAIVGNKEFRQRVYAFQGQVMDFLEDACKYANKLRDKNLTPEVVKTAPIKNTSVMNFLSLLK